MQVTDPERMSQAFADAYNACDIESLLSLYEPEAIYVARSNAVRGATAIREIFARMFAAKGRIEIANDYCLALKDTALVRATWHFKGSGADGKTIETHGHSSEVLRRQSDGTWRYAIDHPLGGD